MLHCKNCGVNFVTPELFNSSGVEHGVKVTTTDLN